MVLGAVVVGSAVVVAVVVVVGVVVVAVAVFADAFEARIVDADSDCWLREEYTGTDFGAVAFDVVVVGVDPELVMSCAAATIQFLVSSTALSPVVPVGAVS
ncbi:hypothetical protein GS539_21400 [Rhodococcus hoagii]|nr:hypothetical protein [Prescottella equi]